MVEIPKGAPLYIYCKLLGAVNVVLIWSCSLTGNWLNADFRSKVLKTVAPDIDWKMSLIRGSWWLSAGSTLLSIRGSRTSRILSVFVPSRFFFWVTVIGRVHAEGLAGIIMPSASQPLMTSITLDFNAYGIGYCRTLATYPGGVGRYNTASVILHNELLLRFLLASMYLWIAASKAFCSWTVPAGDTLGSYALSGMESSNSFLRPLCFTATFIKWIESFGKRSIPSKILFS